LRIADDTRRPVPTNDRKEITTMSLRTRLSALTAVIAALAVAAPVATAGAALPTFPTSGSNANLCLSGVVDPGPLGPSGPYGASGPYGPNGPLHGAANPIGNAASCGGGLTYFLRGGDISSFVNANLASVGITPPASGQ
jgi:hypothetical protein